MAKTRDPNVWMWQRARQLLEDAEQVQRRFWECGPTAPAVPSWAPPLDIFETPTEIWVLVALPGIDPDEIEVLLHECTLTIRGNRCVPAAFRHAILHRMEIPTGRFERAVGLPVRRYELRRKEFANGCLVVSLAKLT